MFGLPSQKAFAELKEKFHKILEQNDKIIKENNDLRVENDKMATELGTLKKRPQTYTQEQMNSVLDSHKKALESKDYDYNAMEKEKDAKIVELEKGLETEMIAHEATKKTLNEYTNALQKLADDRGVGDIALLIVNNIKTFEQFKKDFTEMTKDKLEAKSEKEFQKKMTEFTKGNMEFVNNIVSKGMNRAAALPGTTVVG